MGFRLLFTLLVQPAAEKDPDFAREIRRRSRVGLRLIAWVTIAAPLAISLAAWLGSAPLPAPGAGGSLALIAAGAAALMLSLTGPGRRHARPAGWLLAWFVAASLIWSSSLGAAGQPSLRLWVNAGVAVVLLIALLSIPFKPWHVLLLGLAVEGAYFASCGLAGHWSLAPPETHAGVHWVFLSLLTLLSAAVSVNVYRQIYQTHLSHQQQMRALEELRDAQCRVLLSDNAASMGRLAAALSHELNNALAVLKSNLDTMSGLIQGRPDLPPDKLRAADQMKATLCRNSQEAVGRMQQTVQRIQRLANLDRAEVSPVNLNALLADVADVVRDAQPAGVRFQLEFLPLPDVQARPQALSAVFSALLSNAAQAAGRGGVVKVTTAPVDSSVRVVIQDTGPGLSREQLEQVLDPGFRVRDGRVTSCNWSLFGARQIVRQHGGELELASHPGQGTTVTVTLPASLLLRPAIVRAPDKAPSPPLRRPADS